MNGADIASIQRIMPQAVHGTTAKDAHKRPRHVDDGPGTSSTIGTKSGRQGTNCTKEQRVERVSKVLSNTVLDVRMHIETLVVCIVCQ